MRPVDRDDAPPLIALNADRPYLLASTTKLVTTMAALDLLGPDHRWVTIAQTTGAVSGGRVAGDLVLTGGPVGLTLSELSRWFAKMRAEGVRSVAGNIVLDDFTLLHERDPKQLSTTEQESDAPPLPVAATPSARVYNEGKLLVAVRPADGLRATVTVTPKPANALVVNDVFMGDGGCSAWARWKTPDEIAGDAAAADRARRLRDRHPVVIGAEQVERGHRRDELGRRCEQIRPVGIERDQRRRLVAVDRPHLDREGAARQARAAQDRVDPERHLVGRQLRQRWQRRGGSRRLRLRLARMRRGFAGLRHAEAERERAGDRDGAEDLQSSRRGTDGTTPRPAGRSRTAPAS